MSAGLLDAALNAVEALEAVLAVGMEYGGDLATPRRAFGGSAAGVAAVHLMTMLSMRYLRYYSARVVRSLIRACYTVGVPLGRCEQRALMRRFLALLGTASSQHLANVMWAVGSASEWELQGEQDVALIVRRAAQTADTSPDFTLQASQPSAACLRPSPAGVCSCPVLIF